MKMLIEAQQLNAHGPDARLQVNVDGNTPLHLALLRGNGDPAKLVLLMHPDKSTLLMRNKEG